MHIPMFQGIKPLTRQRILHDVLAGMALAAINIPQVLGYTRIAGTPVVTGLYTVFLPLIAFTLFCSSRHLVVAADSATAAIIFGTLSHIAAPFSHQYMALVGVTTLFTAGFLFLARILRLGFFADFLSRTVLVGFLSGVGIQVGIAMLGDVFGIPLHSGHTVMQAWEILQGVFAANPSTFELSALVISIILLAGRFAPQLPVALLAVIGSIAASATFHFADRGIAVIGPVPSGLPSLTLPDITWAQSITMLPLAFSCGIMILAQSAATARAFASRHHEDVDENADMLGLAVANATASLSGAFVVNGSPTQTAMADRVGARSQIAQLVLAGFALLMLIFLTGPLQYLPRCVLAAVVFTIAIGMVDLPTLSNMRRESPGEFKLAVLTAAVVVVIGVEQGILLAMLLSLFRHVRHSYHPYTIILAPDAAGKWRAIPATPGLETEPGLIIYRFGADLFYANQHRFIEDVHALTRQAPSPVKWFIVDSDGITNIDYSSAQPILDLLRELSMQNITIIFARVRPSLRSDMDRHHITASLGEAQIYTTLHDAITKVHG